MLTKDSPGITPLAGELGAEITGIQLVDVDADSVREITALLVEHQVSSVSFSA